MEFLRQQEEYRRFIFEGGARNLECAAEEEVFTAGIWQINNAREHWSLFSNVCNESIRDSPQTITTHHLCIMYS